MKQTVCITMLLLATGVASLPSQPAYGAALYSVHFVPFFPEVQWDGVVNTAADTLTITQWANPPGSPLLDVDIYPVDSPSRNVEREQVRRTGRLGWQHRQRLGFHFYSQQFRPNLAAGATGPVLPEHILRLDWCVREWTILQEPESGSRGRTNFTRYCSEHR